MVPSMSDRGTTRQPASTLRGRAEALAFVAHRRLRRTLSGTTSGLRSSGWLRREESGEPYVEGGND
jgi:hypothetical protein